MRKLHLAISWIAILMITLTVACEDGIITEEDRPIDIPDTTDTTEPKVPMANLSFIQDSIFTRTCATSGCHNGNGLSPDLTKEGTPDLIGTLYIQPGKPEESLIIARMSSDGADVMPPSYSNFNPHPKPVIDSIAAWIAKGAPIND